MIQRLIVLFGALLLFGCAQAPDHVTFHAAGNPEKLSDWGLFTLTDRRISPRAGMVTYDLATPLFSDYAQKWRTVWMPADARATYDPEHAFDFPVGTIVSKTFYYSTPADAPDPQASATVLKLTRASYQDGTKGLDLTRVRLIETRLLVRRAAGWAAFPYVWNAAGTDATLERTGAEIPLTFEGTTRFVYSVPNQNQCAGCHVQDYRTRALSPIGLKARHLTGDLVHELTGIPARGVTRNARWDDPHADTVARARSYLDINCSHCHNPTGAARTSGLWLDAKTVDPRVLGMCKPPVAAGRGTGNRSFDVVPGHADRSILSYRLQSTDPGEMMPELGRALQHKEGVALIVRYITTLKGACDTDDGTRRQNTMISAAVSTVPTVTPANATASNAVPLPSRS